MRWANAGKARPWHSTSSDCVSMNSSSPAWIAFGKKLKERFNLTDADLTDLRRNWRDERWLTKLQRKARISSLEIAVLVEEATETATAIPVSTPLSLRRSAWA